MLVSVGRMKDGPERELCVRYMDRALDSGRRLGFSGPAAVEIPESKSPRSDERKAQEAQAIRHALGTSPYVCFDERGASLPSEQIADFLRRKNDAGTKELAFVIGGADGLDGALRAQSQAVWSFGAATLPHQIVRILAAEQIYRAMTILSGHPYHRS